MAELPTGTVAAVHRHRGLDAPAAASGRAPSILHHHPVAFLGYVGVMEGYPPSEDLVSTLVERTGFPREGFHTFAAQGELDPGHRDHLDRTLDALPRAAR